MFGEHAFLFIPSKIKISYKASKIAAQFGGGGYFCVLLLSLPAFSHIPTHLAVLLLILPGTAVAIPYA